MIVMGKKCGALRLEEQLCFPLYACARQVVNSYTPLLKPLGLTYTQYIVLLVLWEEDGITVGEIGKKLYLDNGTVTPLLKKLENEELIVRTRSSKDERVVLITLTDKGRGLRDKAEDIPAQLGGCMALSVEERETLRGLLYKLMDSFEK